MEQGKTVNRSKQHLALEALNADIRSELSGSSVKSSNSGVRMRPRSPTGSLRVTVGDRGGNTGEIGSFK